MTVRRTRQAPLPGISGRARYGRTAAASANDPPAYEPGTLPLAWQTVVDPADVLLRVTIPGEPRAKGRPRHTLAKLDDYGALVQGHTYTPAETRQAEERLRWVFLAARTFQGDPLPARVGALCFFRSRYNSLDGDNAWKLVADALQGTVVSNDRLIGEHHVHVLHSCTDPATELLVWRTARRGPGKNP